MYQYTPNPRIFKHIPKVERVRPVARACPKGDVLGADHHRLAAHHFRLAGVALPALRRAREQQQ
jgi:hypothetical protein